MSEQMKEEAEMMNDRNYEVLAQIYTILNDKMSGKGIAMRKVLQKDFDINYSVPSSKCSLPNIVGRTALDFALEKRELEVFKMLISRGADFTNKNQSGSTILHRIIEKSYMKSKKCYKLKGKLRHPFVDAVLLAQIELKNVANPINQDGISHFHIACMFNHVKAVQFFLTQGVSATEAISQDSKIFPGSTPLHLAARYSAFETAKLLLDHNADVDVKDVRGLYPLFLLIQHNSDILDMKNMQKIDLCDKLKDELSVNENMIKLLLEKFKSNEDGLSRCHVACTLQDTQMLENILTQGVNLKDSVSENSSLWPGLTALHFAALFNINAVRLLVANGADIMSKDANGVTPFDLCLQRYSPEAIHSVMTAVPALNKITFCNTQTKVADLIIAMSEVDALRSFWQGTAENANIRVPLDSPVWPGYTILHIAIILSDRIHDNRDLYKDTDYEHVQEEYRCYEERDSYRKIKLCLDMGAEVTMTDFYKSTPLHLAFRLQNRHIVKLLSQYHHKIVNVADSVNLSHLHIACAAGQNDLVKKLLETGIDVNQRITSNFIYRLSDHKEETPNVLYMNPGWTCLHIAMAPSDEYLARLLIKYEADLYAKDSFEMTPIHQVLCSGSRYLGYYILSRKYYENRVTSFGLSHLHVACFVGDLDAVAQLLRRGANMEGTINYNLISSIGALSALAPFDGYTPVHFALRERHFEIVKLLVQRGVNLLAKSADGSIPFYELFNTSSADDNSDASESDSCASEHYYDASEHKLGLNLFNMKKIEEIVKEDSGITRLHVACSEVNRELAIKLLKSGADPNAQIYKDSPVWPGFTPLHNLVTPRFIYEDEEGIEDFRDVTYRVIEDIGISLLEYGASITLKDAKGNTPIHKALEFVWSEPRLWKNECYYVDWMLNGHKDFSVNPVDSRGISHFEIACMSARVKVVENFLQHGVDVNRQFGHFSNHYGDFTPLHLAALCKHKSMADLLVKHGANLLAKDFLGNTPLHTATLNSTLSASDRYYSCNEICETLSK